jgi:hypothetical protein
MRYFIDYGSYLVEYSFEEITQKIEWRLPWKFPKITAGNCIYLVKAW